MAYIFYIVSEEEQKMDRYLGNVYIKAWEEAEKERGQKKEYQKEIKNDMLKGTGRLRMVANQKKREKHILHLRVL